jgi:hypothetical protein
VSKITSKVTSMITRAVADRLSGAFRRYVFDEAVRPFRHLGRRLLYGIAGAVLIAVGSVAALIGLLRALQTETGSTFAGNYSFAPYLITAAAGLLALGGFVAFGFRGLLAKSSGRGRSGARRSSK